MNILKWLVSLYIVRCFHKGDRVESRLGKKGTVIIVYRDKKTNQKVGCAVQWDDNDIDLFLPVENKGKLFNPCIRLL